MCLVAAGIGSVWFLIQTVASARWLAGILTPVAVSTAFARYDQMKPLETVPHL